MIGSSKNDRENYPRKCFRTQEKETRVKINPGLSGNRPLNNWALTFFSELFSFLSPCLNIKALQGIWTTFITTQSKLLSTANALHHAV